MMRYRHFLYIAVALFSALLAGCALSGPDALPDEIVATRPPPEAGGPTVVDQVVDNVTAQTALADASFLGLDVADWINIAVSLLLVGVGYLLGSWLLTRSTVWLARLTTEPFAEEVGTRANRLARWLLLVFLLYVAIFRLTLLSPAVRRWLLDILFVAGLVLLVIILWRALDLFFFWYRSQIVDPERREELDTVLTFLQRLGHLAVVVAGVAWLLSHFGINITALAAALGVGGLALSLAAKDTIADFIAGVIILFDRPFRVGDRIEIQNLGTWGDVTEIGLRTTRIRTRDNRMVIVPNSIIGSSQVVNYTYPDPRYRIELHITIQYGTDIEKLRRIIEETVAEVPGVLQDKPVDALYVDMGEYGMVFRVRWWIESYADTRRMFDKVNTALQAALDANGIRSPYPTQTVLFDQGPPLPDAPSTAAVPPQIDDPGDSADI